ncbi:MAG: antibiotic biosynthesis monooxygenase family protein [Hellea sp.]
MSFRNFIAALILLGLTACAPAAQTPQIEVPAETFTLIGKITTTEGNREEFIALLSNVLAQTNCISCNVLADKSDPNVVWVAETWPSKAAHDEALLAPEVQTTIKKGRPMIVSMERMADTGVD